MKLEAFKFHFTWNSGLGETSLMYGFSAWPPGVAAMHLQSQQFHFLEV